MIGLVAEYSTSQQIEEEYWIAVNKTCGRKRTDTGAMKSLHNDSGVVVTKRIRCQYVFGAGISASVIETARPGSDCTSVWPSLRS